MKAIDPDEVELCKSKHFDVESTSPEDQTRRFPMHRYIDRYSRRISWFSILPSNRNPEIVGKRYSDYLTL